MWWSYFLKLKPVRVSRKWWCPFSMLNFKSPKNVMQPLLSFKIFKIHKKVMRSFLALITVKVKRKWRSPFSVLKTLTVVRQWWSSFWALEALRAVRKRPSPFSAITLRWAFILCTNFLEQYFLCQFRLNFFGFFLWLNISFTIHVNLDEERCRAHFSKYCKSYFSTTPINSFTYIMSEAAVPSFTS